jgi:hypothetical protein
LTPLAMSTRPRATSNCRARTRPTGEKVKAAEVPWTRRQRGVAERCDAVIGR